MDTHGFRSAVARALTFDLRPSERLAGCDAIASSNSHDRSVTAAGAYPPAPAAAVPRHSGRVWPVAVALSAAGLLVVGLFVAFALVASDPGPLTPTATRFGGQPGLQIATCFRQPVTAVRISSTADARVLWSATGRAGAPAVLTFGALPAGLTPSAPWPSEEFDGPVVVSYDLGGPAEPFTVEGSIDYTHITDGVFVRDGSTVPASAIRSACDGRS